MPASSITTATATTSTVTLHLLTSPNGTNVVGASRLLSEAFGTDFGTSLFPNGITPAFIQWRAEQIGRYITLGNLLGRHRTYVATRKVRGDTSQGQGQGQGQCQNEEEEEEVIGVACAYSASLFDPDDDWNTLVPRAVPPKEDVQLTLWTDLLGAFGRAKRRAIAHTGDERWQELIYLCISPSLQRTGTGALLLHRVLSDAGEDQRTFLVTAPTISARPFYLKNGLEKVDDEELEAVRLHGSTLPDRYCIMRWTPEGMR